MLQTWCIGSLVPKPPPFLPSVCIHNNTREQRPILIFGDLPIPYIIVNANRRDQNGVGLGPRLVYWMAKKKS